MSVAAGDVAGTFDVSWAAPESAGGVTLSGYEVHWRLGHETFSDTRSQSLDATATSATVTTGSGTSSRVFRVRAIDEIGESVGAEVTCTHSDGTWTCGAVAAKSV